MLAYPHSTGPMLLRRGAPMNTDADVDCTLYEHIRYRPYCQTIRLEKRRRAASRVLRRRRLPTIQENLCMFEWLHRTEAHKGMTNDELLYVLLNGLFHQDNGNVAIVINRDQLTGRPVTSQMSSHFGKSESRGEALKAIENATKTRKVSLTVPDEIQKVQLVTSPCDENADTLS